MKDTLLRRRTWLVALMVLIACMSACTKTTPPTQTEQVEPAMKQEKGYTIDINNDTDATKNPDPRECPLSKGKKPDEDHVRWHNVSGHDITLTFAVWPFMETWAPITILKGAYSPYYSLNKDLPEGKYEYKGNPPLPSGGPGEPAIVDGP